MFDALIATTTTAITTSLTSNLPQIFGVFAGLVGLGVGLHFIKRLIGGRA